jgi:hypothetical protein
MNDRKPKTAFSKVLLMVGASVSGRAVRKRGEMGLKWAKERWGDHLHRAKILYRWMRQRFSRRQPLRSILGSILRLLRANLYELLGWSSPPSSGEDVGKMADPKFTPYTPELDSHFGSLPEVGDVPSSPEETAPPPGL